MEMMSVESGAKRLQLLAVDALLEHARAGTSSEDACVCLLRHIAEMGARLEQDAKAVSEQELNKARVEAQERFLRM